MQKTNQKELIAIVRQNSFEKGFVTDFYFKDENGVRGVNKLLGEMIHHYNEAAKQRREETGKYQTIIPMESNGWAPLTYSFGCGNTSYLQASLFEDLCKHSPELAKDLPLNEASQRIDVYLPGEHVWASEKYDFQF